MGCPLKIVNGLDRLLHLISEGANLIGSFMILFIMVVMSADIFGRTLLNQPLSGVPEMVTIAITAVVFLQFSSTLRAGRMIGVDSFTQWLGTHSLRAEQVLIGIWCILGAVAFLCVAVGTWPLLMRAYASGDSYGSSGIFMFPKWPVRAVIVAGSSLVMLDYLGQAYQHFHAAWYRITLKNELDPANRILS